MERIQKVLARAGVGARRTCEELVRAGRVQVGGKVATIGMKVDPARATIYVDGKRIHVSQNYVYCLLYKPKGYVSTVKDPQGRPKVTDLVHVSGVRLFPVGRLDFDTSGLILLTNDGKLAYLLTHPKYGVWKTYQALVRGRPAPAALAQLEKGVLLPEGKTTPAHVRLLKQSGDQAWLEISLREGKKRQVRKMCEAVGHPVLDLKRTKLAFLDLKGLHPGQFRLLSTEEVLRLKKIALNGASRQD
ncbi:MAG: pseudouridine synthase [Bacillota bacterium]|nr:pseudouridine synthase [Bacillota bacterium]